MTKQPIPQTTNLPNNQTTKRPISQTTKRLNNQTTNLPNNQTERIKQMERCLDRASQAVARLSAALDDYADTQDALRQLSDYYGSDLWKHDCAADTSGTLPHDLKRGVLSEDAVWNLLEDVHELKERMRQMRNEE